ncbi:MAG: hypothetical protein AB3N14_06715 [Flavobacteriaceae bacterium]
MEILFYSATFCLLAFMVLATYDGFYLHLWKYELFNKRESLFEHKTHTVRALLFPLIVWFLFVDTSGIFAFLLGMVLVVIDLVVLGIDAYSEKESRTFMGGLPMWEYIIHLFSNGFHFSAIVLAVVLKFRIIDGQLVYLEHLASSPGKELLSLISINILPGAILLGLIHLLLLLPKPQFLWHTYRRKINCC